MGPRIASMLHKFTDQLSPVTDVQISTQNLHYVHLPSWDRWDELLQVSCTFIAFVLYLLMTVVVACLQTTVLDSDKLPLLVNPLEPHLTTVEAHAPVFRLLVYHTDRPTVIVDYEGEAVRGNSFVVASWGSVSLVNNCSTAMDEDRQLQLVADLIAQMRVLLGLESDLPPRSAKDNAPIAQ